jgi:hypothetical protein
MSKINDNRQEGEDFGFALWFWIMLEEDGGSLSVASVREAAREALVAKRIADSNLVLTVVRKSRSSYRKFY